MKPSYKDLYALTDKKPVWFDEHGVPRWCEFHPSCVNIYADEVCLLEIACQFCNAKFEVAIVIESSESQVNTLKSDIEDKSVYYGDPPNAGCCIAGASANSESLRVLEYWSRPKFEWVRNAEFEVTL